MVLASDCLDLALRPRFCAEDARTLQRFPLVPIRSRLSLRCPFLDSVSGPDSVLCCKEDMRYSRDVDALPCCSILTESGTAVRRSGIPEAALGDRWGASRPAREPFPAG